MTPRSLPSIARLGLFALGVGGAGCRASEPVEAYALALRVSGQQGAPLARAAVSLEGASLGASDLDGLIVFELSGREGEVRRLELHCPEGHVAAEPAFDVTLRRFSDDSPAPEYAARCTAVEQNSVVVVRADNGASLPILHLGREVARTDPSGAAHFMLQTPPGETIELRFDTTESPRLRPQNPNARFAVTEHDDVILVSQSFSLLPPQRVARHRPYRLRSAKR